MRASFRSKRKQKGIKGHNKTALKGGLLSGIMLLADVRERLAMLRKEVVFMSVFEAISLMILFATLVAYLIKGK
jgi:SpoU rRNA methylase family enzyme